MSGPLASPVYLSRLLRDGGCLGVVVGSLILTALMAGCGSSCEGIEHAPAGTKFRVTVLLESPRSTGCHLYPLVPEQTFELLASGKVSGGVGSETCEFTGAAGPPAGPNADFEYDRCRPLGQLSSECLATYAACPGQVGRVAFGLNAPIPDDSPTTGTFSIHHSGISACPEFGYCIDTYDVRVERLE